MLAVKGMNLRENFKSFCDKVYSGETLIISRPKNENIVMISEAEYNEIIKAKKNLEYLMMLNKSISEVKDKEIVIKALAELESFENNEDSIHKNRLETIR